MSELTEKQIIKIISDNSYSEVNVTLKTTFGEVNLGSMDRVLLSFDIEEATHINIPDDVVAQWRDYTTIQQVLASVNAL